MAEKDSKPKTNTKPAASAKSASTTAKPSASTKSASTTAKPANKAAATRANETAAAAKATAPKAAAKPKTTAKQPKEKQEKPAKAQRSEGKGKAEAVAITKNNKIRIIAIIALSFVCILAIVLGLALGLKSCSDSSDDFNPVSELDRYDATAYKTNTKVLYSGEVIGTVKANKPVEGIKNEGDAFDSAATGTIFANGAKRYPTYGSTLKTVIGTGEAQVAARQAIISESGYLCAWGTAGANRGGEQTPDKYTRIDKDGYLYQDKDGQWIHSLVWGKTADEYTEENYRQLYKHSAAQGMYMEGYTKNGVTYEIADNADRVVKQVKMQKRGYGYGITGLYAPAGEVIKVELSGKDMNATGGISIHIGQALYNGQANNIWASKNQMQRFPYLLTTLNLNKSTCDYNEETDTWTGYIGSFIGGPIYIRSNVTDFTAKISGGVEYLHFILGYTTEAEFNRLKTSSRVPMFDLEVWDRGVLLSGPRYYAETFSYEDLYKVAVLWDKVSSVTAYGDNSTGIVFLFDPFVAAGAAVAFPGRSSVNCPTGWMSQALNYNGIVTSGSWGNFHEYHHNFQGYGVGGGGEVTNNGLTLVSYSLFTKISSNRGIGSFGAAGLGGWNRYTSATWALEQTLKIARKDENPENGNQGLALYATLLHNFGPDAYTKTRKGGQSYSGYMNAWQDVTHNNMWYYFNDILKGTGISNNAPTEYPMFVPVSSVYQTGRSYMYDGQKKYFQSMQPYVIPYGDSFTFDLRKYSAPNGQYAQGSIVIPDGFSYEITNITQPENGTISSTNTNGVYVYTPDANKKDLKSGKIYATLKITKDDGSFLVDDVDLVLEFEQSHETNKMTINRTTYTYAADKMYTDAVTAYENGFTGYTGDPVKQNQFNPTQNANTDIWFRPDTDKAHNDYPNDPDKYFIHDNQIDVLDGKLYFSTDGKYRVYLRGRDNCAVYYSLDGKTYSLGARITESTPTNGATANFRVNAPETYFDVEYTEGTVKVTTYQGTEAEGKTVEYTIPLSSNKKYENWLYVKEILVDHKSPNVSFIGLGYNQWEQAMFTIEEVYYKSDNKTTVDGPDAEGYAYTKATYKNYRGIAIAYTKTDKNGNTEYFKQDNTKITSKEFSEMTESKLNPPTSVNYANAYRITYEFPDNKGFQTDYFYTRSYEYNYNDFVPSDAVTVTATNYKPEGWGKGMPITNISDGKTNTYIHTSWEVNAKKPLELTFDIGDTKKINRITFDCRNNNGMKETPKAFTIQGSLDGITWFDVAEFTNAPTNPKDNSIVYADFPETTLRYCTIKISAAHQGNGSYYIVIGEITFSCTVPGAKLISTDDAMFNYSNGWHGAQATSTFGHILVGNKNATVSFEFEGTRLGILSSPAYGRDFEVVIDGKVVNSIELTHDKSVTSLNYLCETLEQGKHTVTIKCINEANIDSIVIYP